MQRYQPPHMRQRAAPQPLQAQAGPSGGNIRMTHPDGKPANINSNTRPNRGGYSSPQPSRRDWSTPVRKTDNVLSSPASDLQPMRKTPVKAVDEMELIQSVSRSGGDGAEGDALKDWSMQEKYRRYIDERLDKHYSIWTTSRNQPPAPTATEELYSLGSIVLLFRKLREGVVASHRMDMFAIEVFESSARLSILARNTTQLLSSLSGLVPGLYSAVDPKGKSRVSSSGADIAERLERLDISDTRAEFASILLLFHLAHSGSYQAFHNTFIELTCPIPQRLRHPFSDTPTSAIYSTIPFISPSKLAYAVKASRVLAEGRFDPLAYFRLMGDLKAAGPYERAVLSWAEDRVREKAWKVMSKAYLGCTVERGARWCGRDVSSTEDWVKGNGGRIENGLIKMR